MLESDFLSRRHLIPFTGNEMRSLFSLKTITWVFLVLYLLTGGTDGFGRCLGKPAHRGTAPVHAGAEAAPSIQGTAAGIPPPLRNQNGGTRSCPKLAPALTSTAGLDMLEFPGKLSSAAPAHLSRAVSSAFSSAAGNESRCLPQPTSLVNPRLAHIRAVVLLT